MHILLLIASLVAVWGTNEGIQFEGKLKEKLFDYRTRSQNIHLDHLDKELSKLENAFEKYEKKYPLPTLDDARQLKARVSNLEESLCRPRHVRCGKSRAKCANELTFCDGHKDCDNGFDESEEICHANIAKVGRAYAGMVTWHSCGNYQPHNVVISIVSTDNIEHFAAYTKVRAVIAYNHDDTPEDGKKNIHSIDAHGYYSAGKRMLALEADDNSESHVAVKCLFNLGDDDHADCKIVEKASLHVCATFRAEEI